MKSLQRSVFVCAAALALLACNTEEPLPRFGKVPAFELRDQQDRPVTAQLFASKVTVVDFIFTSCPDVCPLLTSQLAGLRARLPADPALSFVSFSVDPEHDSPEQLAAFAAKHAAAQPNWHFLTGDVASVKRVVTTGFKQAMEAEPAVPNKPRNVLHGTHYVVVDRQGEMRGFYRSDADGTEQLMKAVKTLLAEEPSP